jgi:hypothetical protein
MLNFILAFVAGIAVGLVAEWQRERKKKEFDTNKVEHL